MAAISKGAFLQNLRWTRLFQVRYLALLFVCALFAGGCASDASEDESDINRYFDGPVVRRLIQLMDAVDDAEGGMNADRDRLSKEMSTFGPALTQPQQTAYVNAYNRLTRVAGNQRAYVNASRALHDFMQSGDGGGALKKNAPRISAAAEAIFLGHKRLATTPYALDSAGYAAWVMDRRNQTDPVVIAVRKYAWKVDVLAPAITNGAGTAVAEAEGDANGAFAKLAERLSPLAYVTQDHVEVYKGWTALVVTVRSRKMTAFGGIEARYQKLPVVGALMAVGALYNLLAVAGDVQNGDIGQETFATLGDAGQQLAGAMISISQAGLVGKFGGAAAATFSKFIQRITPGLGILCTTAALRNHISKMGDEGAIGAYIGALGDVIALVGVVAESFGITAPLGAIIVGLGFTLSFLGDAIQDWLAEAAVQAEEKVLLRKLGFGESIIDVFVDISAKHLQAWVDLGYNAAKLQWLASNVPNALTAGWFSGFTVAGYARLVKDFGYSADVGFGLLNALPPAAASDVDESSNGRYDFVRDIGDWSAFRGADVKGQWIRAIRAQAALGPAFHGKAFAAADNYLTTH